MIPTWDYLIVTASNERQAEAYRLQLALRRLPQVRHAMVVADLDGRRIGSGASTLDCLRRVTGREGTLDGVRILIVHAGGDSRRLPAYGPAGKIFIPVPGDATLFDLLVPSYLRLASGQIVVASGDALLQFDASTLTLAPEGFTIVTAPATPAEAARHGVVVCGDGARLRLYLQKPPIAEQSRLGAISEQGETLLDIGVMSFDAATARALLETFGVRGSEWSADLYREICCAFGSEATLEHYRASARASGSKWSDAEFAAAFPSLNAIRVHVRVVPQCRFLHFGSTRQLIESGAALHGDERLSINNVIGADGRIAGDSYWVEACRINAPLELAGSNVVIGIDVDERLRLPRGACLDVLRGEHGWFARPHGIGDSFKEGGTFVNRPLDEWLRAVGAQPEDVWDSDDRTLWTARVFPVVAAPSGYRDWLWFYEPEKATAADRARFFAARRHSAAEIALLADQAAFNARRYPPGS